MSEVEISTSGLAREVKVKIDGHVFTVRKMGAGDQLDIQRKAAQLARAMQELSELQEKAKVDSSDSNKLFSELDKILDEVTRLSAEIGERYIKLFNDGTKNQTHARKLLEKYDIEGLRILNDRAFQTLELKGE